MASTLLLRTALAQIEQALHRVIRQRLSLLTATVADLAALRAVATQSSGANALPEYTQALVSDSGLRWEWRSASTAADDGKVTVRPDDVPTTEPGRWAVTDSKSTTGYLAAVHYWDGESTKKQFQERILSVSPTVAIIWDGSTNDPRSNVPGAIYDYSARFSLWCVDQNLRPRFESYFGSEYGADTEHPGVIAMIGDVKKVLADCNKQTQNVLGFAGGVKTIAIGEEVIEDADLDERQFILSLGVEVFASVENPDGTDEVVAVDSVYVQQKRQTLNAQAEYDPDNFVVRGYVFTPGGSLTATPSSGEAAVGGYRVASSPPAHTFTAQRDTYVDLNGNGSLVYLETVNDGVAPEVTAGALRLGRVVTDSLGITRYVPIAAVADSFGSAFQALPAPDSSN